MRYLHEHAYARRIPHKIPEPPDREAWIIQREEFAPQLSGLLDDPEIEVFLAMMPDSKVIQGHGQNG